jgi:asparagine synthase (glutamine-hydrolysing)
MCGIAGYVNWSGEPADRLVLDRMLGSIRHRGPDEDGILAAGPVGLAHSRLSIIDIAGGRQPMTNADGSLSITFNGEIFNYLELRADLEARGHRFVTKSDTEVLLHAYEERGERCVDDLNGQWAFAVWDSRRRLLFCSRDRMGVRPLFYSMTAGTFVFGSEIKSLFRHPAVKRELDLCGLDQTFTFWTPLAPRTAFRHVCELPPGHSMTVTARSSRVRRYWALTFRLDGEARKTDAAQSAEELTALLADATRIRLRSDVPVGAYLSGGLDSTIIASLVRQRVDQPLKTFSVAFDDPEFDESVYQREVARFLGTEHSEFRCSYDDIGRSFPSVVWQSEKPLVRTAPAPLFLLAKLVREQGYKVVLTGEGADEIFGGYDLFKEAKIRRFCAARPDSRLRPLLLKRLYPYLPQLQSQSVEYLQAFFGVQPDDCLSPFFSHLPRWRMTSRLKLFFSDDVKAQLADYDALADLRLALPSDYSKWDGLSQAQYLEAAVLLPGYILSSQGDRMAMAHAVEGRFPFLDHRVVDFASKLPPALKMRVLNEKYLLKQLSAHLIPEIVRRRPKQPYRAPDSRSFFGSFSRPVRHDYIDDLLSPETIRRDGLFAAEAVQRLVQKARIGKAVAARDSMALVGILSTQLLLHQFVHDFQ